MKTMTRTLCGLMALALLLSACLLPLTAMAETGNPVEVTIPHYKSGENVGGKFFLPQVERFNAKYEGQYKITIEEVTQDLYVDKIKQLGAQNKLPVLIEGGDTTWMQEVVIPTGMFRDLSGLVNAKPELKALLDPPNLEYNNADGKLVSITLPITFPITLFYNEALFAPSKPMKDMSWADVAAELGDNKIAFMTSENAWTTMLAMSSLVAVEEGGADLLRRSVTDKITDFNQPALVNAFTKLQALLQNNASSNSVGAAYADAANSFMSMNAAIICNGSWMVGDFAPESSDKWSNGFDGATVRGDVLPGNMAIANTLGYGWWIPATASDDEAALAEAFIEFMCSPEELEASMLEMGGVSPRLQLSEGFLAKRAENKLLDEYIGAVNADTIIAPAFADAIPSSVANVEFGKLLPKLIDGSFTPEQFCDELTKKAAETAY